MPEVSSTRLPVPHLFMVVTIGLFALMMVSAEPTGCPAGTAVLDPSCTGDVLQAGAAVEPAVPAVDGLTVGSLVALLALLAATISAGRAGAHGSGRPILGFAAGLLAGLAGATSLFSVGAITLSSPMWVYVPLVLATLGTALGATAPLRRR